MGVIANRVEMTVVALRRRSMMIREERSVRWRVCSLLLFDQGMISLTSFRLFFTIPPHRSIQHRQWREHTFSDSYLIAC